MASKTMLMYKVFQYAEESLRRAKEEKDPDKKRMYKDYWDILDIVIYKAGFTEIFQEDYLGMGWENYEQLEAFLTRHLEAKEIAEEIQARDTWDNELNMRLCELAGLEEEYKAAGADSFEQVVFKAADELEVELIGPGEGTGPN